MKRYIDDTFITDLRDSVIERDGLNLSAATGSYAEKYNLLKSELKSYAILPNSPKY